MIKLENISFDHCIKCTVCTIYCPVARATHKFPGPKQSGPDAERLRIKNPELVDGSLKYCTNCKRCEIACPSDVKIASIIHDAKWKYLKKGFFRPRDFFMSHTDLIGGMGVIFSPIVNFMLSLFPVKIMMDIFMKIPHRRIFPKYESGRFSKKIRRTEAEQKKYTDRVTYFHGCFVNYNNHKLGYDLVKVLNAMNIGVDTAPEKCCGVPLIANGYLEKAKKNGVYNIKNLTKSRETNGGKIVSTSSSCSYALKHEYSHFLQLDNSRIYNDIEYITKFLFSRFESGNVPEMKPVNIRVAYHSPCHLERMGGVIYTIGVLKKIPGLDLVILSSECCGIAGTYGFKNEYYEISQDIGSQLFRSIEKANPEFVVTDCETCAMQIEMNTNYRVLHPVNILAMALDRNG
jgi:glycerol-3-phosphate dehydrogenase subunit C